MDARRSSVPDPVLDLAATPPSTRPRGGSLVLLATDPAAAHDMPAWCRMRGHRFVEERPAGDHTAYVVEVIEQDERQVP